MGKKYEIVYDPTDSSCIFICKNGGFLRANLSSQFNDFQGLSALEAKALKQSQQKERQIAKQNEVAASVAITQAVQSKASRYPL